MNTHTVLITGSSRGIGHSIYQKLVENKYRLIAPTRADLDLLNNASIDAYIDKHKNDGIDIIINNAGINYPQWIEDISDQNMDETFQVNIKAPIRLIRGLIGTMKKKKWGRIVNVSSAFGVVARGKQVLYVATKHALIGATKALALELAEYQILVNAICPGFTSTELVLRNSPEKIRIIEADIPLKRLAQPEEIAESVYFLVSENNTYITGSSLIIDGGFSIK